VKQVLLEGLAVAVVGAAIGFGANAISPRGLNLTRDYFTLPPVQTASASLRTNAPFGPGSTDPVSPEQELLARLSSEGLQTIPGDEVSKLFSDPRAKEGQIIFVDARNDHEYQKGHIPGALQFDHFRYADYLVPVLTACQTAEQVIVYCNGGKCTDSEYASLMLRDQGNVPGAKIFIYTGGTTDWVAKHHPLETGARNSGTIINSASK
jgi:rhodanese-related sulfurtransferase